MVAMTELIERAIARLKTLILEEVEAEIQSKEAVANFQDALAKLAAEAISVSKHLNTTAH